MSALRKPIVIWVSGALLVALGAMLKLMSGTPASEWIMGMGMGGSSVGVVWIGALVARRIFQARQEATR